MSTASTNPQREGWCHAGGRQRGQCSGGMGGVQGSLRLAPTTVRWVVLGLSRAVGVSRAKEAIKCGHVRATYRQNTSKSDEIYRNKFWNGVVERPSNEFKHCSRAQHRLLHTLTTHLCGHSRKPLVYFDDITECITDNGFHLHSSGWRKKQQPTSRTNMPASDSGMSVVMDPDLAPFNFNWRAEKCRQCILL